MSNNQPTCIFCDTDRPTYKYLLHETPAFRVACDAHPLTEGHILIVPKEHISCIGAYPQPLFDEFVSLYKQFSDFTRSAYGSVSTFEHGIFGQTIFHSHVHILPYKGRPQDIVTEGPEHYTQGVKLTDLREELRRDGGYLFFSIDDQTWLADPALKEPRFFRDRFVHALEAPERMNWREAQANPQLMEQFEKENQSVLDKWNKSQGVY